METAAWWMGGNEYDYGVFDFADLMSNNISDISPLVGNSGLSAGDYVFLIGNPLSATSVNVTYKLLAFPI